MKKTTMALAGILAVSFALPAMAGPNWTIIHSEETYATKQHPQTGKNHNLQQDILPVGHGPRALSTSWLNKERELYLISQEQKKKAPVIAYHDFHKFSRS